MATRSAKPNGFRVIDSTVVSVQEFLDPLPVDDLPGVGYSTRQKLQAAGLSLCQHVRDSSVETLKALLGQSLGVKLHRICCGVETAPVDFESLNCSEGAKGASRTDSIGVQMSWGVRLVSIPHVHIFFRCLAAELCSRAAKANLRGSMLTLKLWIRSEGAPEAAKHMGHGVCYQVSKSGHMPPSCTEVTIDDVMSIAIACFEKCRSSIHTLTADDIRGVGITLSRLQEVECASELQQLTFNRHQVADFARSSGQPSPNSAPTIKSPPSKLHFNAQSFFTAQLPVTTSEVSPLKRARQSRPDVITDVITDVVISAPAQKRQWREPAISSSQLDQHVLAALPPELRRQVQEDAKQVSALKQRNKEFNRRSGFDAPVQGRDQSAQDLAFCMVPEAPPLRVFALASSTGDASLEQVLQMKRSITAWMSAGFPNADDVRLIGAIIRSFTTARYFDSLRSFLLALARCAHGVSGGEKQLVWVEWVGRAIEFAQKKVLAEHGSVLCLS
jgi:DNA repair protein REV1